MANIDKLKVSHDDAVKACEYFDARARRYEGKVSQRGMVLTPELQAKCVQAADNDLFYAMGFRVRDMFA